MNITFRCQWCGETLEIDEVHQGQITECIGCLMKITVPTKMQVAEVLSKKAIQLGTKTFLLITNTSGCTYWSYLGHRLNAPEFAPEIKKYGIIFINRNGGYFTADNIYTVHKVVIGDKFPAEQTN